MKEELIRTEMLLSRAAIERLQHSQWPYSASAAWAAM